MAAQPDRLREIVLELTEVDSAELTETSLFQEDLGLDSMTGIEIQAAVERVYQIVIDEDQLPRLATLGGLRGVVSDALHAKTAQAEAQ